MTKQKNSKRGYTARQLADMLEKRIDAGEWPNTGTLQERRLPTRSTLIDQYKTHANVLDEAIRILRVRGRVITRRGSGTYVRPPKPVRIIVPSQDAAEWTSGDAEHKELPAMSWIVTAMGLTPDTPIHRVRRVLLRNGDVYALSDTYATSPDAAVEEVDPTAAADWIRTWLPASDEAALLGMPQEVPVIALLNTVDGGANVRIYPGDRIEYRSPTTD